MQIQMIQTLSDSHGAAQYETCECCNRKVRTIGILDDGKVMGIQCAITLSVSLLSSADFALASERLGTSEIAALIGASGQGPMVKKAIAIRNKGTVS